MRVSLGADAARRNVDELITGLWTFANALGVLTDDIGERTAAAGVTVDGLLIKDAGIPEAAVTAHEAALAILESQITSGSILARLADNETVTGAWSFDEILTLAKELAVLGLVSASSTFIRTTVVGDSVTRFLINADGGMTWGTGAAARDTNLFRNSANVLKTDDSFHVGAELQVGTNMVLSVQETALAAQADDFALGNASIQRFDLTGAQTITGMVSTVDDQVVYIVNADATQALTLAHENVASAITNRFHLEGNANKVIAFGAAFGVWYDGTQTRWRPLTT